VADHTQRVPTKAPWDPLFHCADLQGLILGVGLYSVERMFTDQLSGVIQTADLDKSAKKRKAEVTSHIQEDDEYLSNNGQRKKAKSGIGYDGAVKEDVRSSIRQSILL